MDETTEKKQTTDSPELTASLKCEKLSDLMEPQQRVDFLQTNLEMTPSRHGTFSPWIPFPLDQPVVSEAAVPAYNERRLESHEWVELLEQTECLDYVSPDVEACMEKHRQLQGNQELELTGREFIDSPAIPKLPPLNALSTRPTILKPILRSHLNVPRHPGLREKFPRQQPPTDNQTYFDINYASDADHPAELKYTTRRSSTTKRYNTETAPVRSASRSLKFETAQTFGPTSRRKRASWGGKSSTPVPSRQQCKSARKSKDCMIPGCTKGARSRGLCKRHGGGKRCTYLECARSDQGGGFCIAHGGGKRCATEGCKNSAQSRGLCKSHGGGKRCREEGCTKSSQAGGFCRGHKQTFV